MASLGGAYISKLDRYELKYIIPSSLIEPLTQYLLAFCEFDYHSTISPNYFYPVNSLYFDTPNYLFLRNRMYTRSPRFNVRSRSYGLNPKPPYFLEIKYKDGNVVNKYRAKVDDSEWPRILTDLSYRTDEQGSELEMRNKELFYRTTMKYRAEPKIFTHYKRRAFVSNLDEYARVTMDIGLSYYLEDQYSLVPDANRLINYDHENVYVKNTDSSEGSNVILELKCYPHQVPVWLIDMIRIFQLNRTSFSKYMSSILTAKDLDPHHKQFYNFHDRENSFYR